MSRTTATVAASLPDHWEELVTTALLGTDRRTPPGAAPGPRAPSALLDAVAGNGSVGRPHVASALVELGV
ncbi:hypothetical protein AB0N39_29675, partial [Streptomyces cellulosae]